MDKRIILLPKKKKRRENNWCLVMLRFLDLVKGEESICTYSFGGKQEMWRYLPKTWQKYVRYSILLKSGLTEVDGKEITSHSTQFYSLFSVTGGEGVTGQAYNDYLLC